MTEALNQVTFLLNRWSEKDSEALNNLIPLVYEQMRHIAENHLRNYKRGQTLDVTVLVHEAYLKLKSLDSDGMVWDNRARFFGLVARIMRFILVDNVRHRLASKRNGNISEIPVNILCKDDKDKSFDLIILDEALNELEKLDPKQSKIVELRFFSGLTIEETAEIMQLSPATIKREWTLARAWLRCRLKEANV